MLKGQRVRLRALEPEDAEQLYRWHLDHEFSVLDGIVYPTSRAQWQESLQSRVNPSSAGVTFGIEDGAAELIGYVALKRIRREDRNAEFGIAIKRDRWQQGYGRDATMTLLRFAFTEMNQHRVSLTVADYNDRARHVYESCGFKEEGRLREALYREGRYCDNVLMAILDREFLQTS